MHAHSMRGRLTVGPAPAMNVELIRRCDRVFRIPIVSTHRHRSSRKIGRNSCRNEVFCGRGLVGLFLCVWFVATASCRCRGEAISPPPQTQPPPSYPHATRSHRELSKASRESSITVGSRPRACFRAATCLCILRELLWPLPPDPWKTGLDASWPRMPRQRPPKPRPHAVPAWWERVPSSSLFPNAQPPMPHVRLGRSPLHADSVPLFYMPGERVSISRRFLDSCDVPPDHWLSSSFAVWLWGSLGFTAR